MAITNKPAVTGGASILPSDAEQGLADHFVGVITDAKWDPNFDYNGKLDHAVLALAIEITPDDPTIKLPNDNVQEYSAGDSAKKDFDILPGGTRIAPKGTKIGLPNNSKAVTFILSLRNAGMTEEQMHVKLADGTVVKDDISAFIGIRAQFHRVAKTSYDNLKGANKEGGTDLLVERILEYGVKVGETGAKPVPAGKPVAAAKKSQPSTKATTASPTNGFDSTARATELVLEKVLSNGGSATKQELAQHAFNAFESSDPNRNGVVNLIAQDTFLSQPTNPWKYDGSKVSMAA